jgi:hypothetical protein
VRTGILVVGLATALALAAAGPAMATRYASPAGSSTDPTCAAAAPCSLVHAVAIAASGEEIVVAQGDYNLKTPAASACTGPFDPANAAAAVAVGNRYVHGQPGRPRPRLIGEASSCVVLNVAGAGRASHLEVIGANTSAPEAAAVLIDGGGNADDLVTGGANGTVHMRNGARLLDSVVGARAQDGAAIFTHFGVGVASSFIINVTALGDVVADSVPIGGAPDAVEIACVNSIATGKFLARLTNAVGGSYAHVNRDHCAGSVATSGANTATPDVGGSIAGATLVPGDYHQAATSPTRDAGRLDPTLSFPDIDGGARTVGANPDIGADEFGSASAVVDSGAVQAVSGASAVVAGTVFPGGVPTDAYVEYGPTTGYGSQTAPVGAGGGFAAVPLTFSLTGMTVNASAYHYRLVGTNGGARGEDRVIAFADADGDGYFSNADCNDGNAAVHPGRGDIPDNGIDEDCSGADAVNLDRDGDRYPRPLDCDDANPAINPGATDVPGNGVDEDCKDGDAPYPVLTSTVGFAVSASARFTVFTDLFVRRARGGSTIRLRCNGRGCPFRSKRIQVRRDQAKLSLRKLVRGARLRPGARLRVSITLPQTVGVDTTLTVRKRQNPARRDACLLPGATRASRCAA